MICSPVLNTTYAFAFAELVSLLSGSTEIPICLRPPDVPEVEVSISEVDCPEIVLPLTQTKSKPEIFIAAVPVSSCCASNMILGSK